MHTVAKKSLRADLSSFAGGVEETYRGVPSVALTLSVRRADEALNARGSHRIGGCELHCALCYAVSCVVGRLIPGL